MAQKVALISGITGQDGAYLAELLLKKGYIVHGIKRRSSLLNTNRVDHIYEEPQAKGKRFHLHYGDLSDSTNLVRIIQEVQPDEIYNLGAQTHVKVSFEAPEYTADVDGIGPLRILEAIRILGLEEKTRFYQASTSELYGLVQEIPQTERTPFYPRSPYGVAKLYAYWITVNYREAYGIHAMNGILFNHESPLRGETFVTRKITHAVARINLGASECLYLGNLDAKRDWGHTREYVEGMWRIMNAKTPEDFVLASGRTTAVRDFCKMAFSLVGTNVEFSGKGKDEVGRCTKTGKTIVRIDPEYYRPSEVELLIGDAKKAKETLGWESTLTVEEICHEMLECDLYRTRFELGLLPVGSKPPESLVHHEGGFLGFMKAQKVETYAKP